MQFLKMLFKNLCLENPCNITDGLHQVLLKKYETLSPENSKSICNYNISNINYTICRVVTI